MIFLTVGTQFAFDRLVRAVDELIERNLLDEEIYAQIGESLYKPRNFEYVDSLEKGLFDDYIRRASKVISHAGMGSITTALNSAKPLIVMPRLKQYGEVVNNHQLDIAKKFEQYGYLLVAYEIEELSKKISALNTFVPRKRHSQADKVAMRISNFLNELCNSER